MARSNKGGRSRWLLTRPSMWGQEVWAHLHHVSGPSTGLLGQRDSVRVFGSRQESWLCSVLSGSCLSNGDSLPRWLQRESPSDSWDELQQMTNSKMSTFQRPKKPYLCLSLFCKAMWLFGLWLARGQHCVSFRLSWCCSWEGFQWSGVQGKGMRLRIPPILTLSYT